MIKKLVKNLLRNLSPSKTRPVEFCLDSKCFRGRQIALYNYKDNSQSEYYALIELPNGKLWKIEAYKVKYLDRN